MLSDIQPAFEVRRIHFDLSGFAKGFTTPSVFLVRGISFHGIHQVRQSGHNGVGIGFLRSTTVRHFRPWL